MHCAFFLSSLDDYEIKEVYRIGIAADSPLQILDYGNWSSAAGLSLNPLPLWERRANLQGFKFRIASNFNPPYVHLVTENCNGPACFKGMYADVWHELMTLLNFTYDLSPPPDLAWGTKLEDDTWNGMIGQLMKDEIDIAVTEFTITQARSEVVDFALPIAESHQKIFIKNPADDFNWFSYVEPLSWSSWSVILAFIAVIPPFLAYSVQRAGDPNEREFTLSKSYFYVAGAMTIARGWNVTPWSIQTRLIFATVMINGALIYWHWEAAIISFLAVRNTVLPFNSLEEMATSTDFKVAVQPGTSYVDTFRYSNNPMLKRIWTDRIEDYIEDYPQSKIGLITKILEDPEYALFDNFYTTITYEPYKKCEIVAIPIAYFPVQFAYGFQKKSPYFDLFWFHMNKMLERGTTKQILQKYEAEPQVCPDYSGKPIGFSQCFTAFLILLAGMFTAILFFSLEKGYRNSKFHRLQKEAQDRAFFKELGNGWLKESAGKRLSLFGIESTIGNKPSNMLSMSTAELIRYHEKQLEIHQRKLREIKGAIKAY